MRVVSLLASLLVGVAFVAALAALASPALAHPGGGQHYHSAPAHSAPAYHPPPSYHPPVYNNAAPTSDDQPSGEGGGGIGVVVLFLIVVIVLIAVARARRGQPRGHVAVSQSAQADGVAALRGEDPSFDPAAFAARAQQTMAKVNEAWCRGNMGPARRLVSDGVYVRFQTQLALLHAAGLKNVMADWRPLGAEVMAAEADPLWDTVHVKMVAEGRDADVPASLPAAEAEAKARSAPKDAYEEVWSFVRRRGQKSKAGVPAMEGRCPGCGADLPLGDVVRCQYCKAVVNSGEHDWVLAEITQPEAWGPTATGDVPGLAELRQRDPTVSRQALEDRASVVFWKWIDATVTGQRPRLDRFCLERGQPPVERASLAEVAVGSSEVRELAAGADGRDHAVIDIVWSARASGDFFNRTDRFVLARSSTAQSKRGLSSLDCPNCGAPLADSDAPKCTACGEALGGGRHEWALESVQALRAEAA